ncbi:MAG: histidinol-phosphate transaminase [Pseudomonadota bacterium]
MTQTRSGPRPLASILDIVPYKGGEKPATGHKLSSNENPLGAAPIVQDALREAAAHLELYPDGGASALRQAIAEAHGLDPDRIVCGAGSDEIFQLLGRAYLAPGDNIIQSEHGFLVYGLVAQQSGAEIRSAPENDYTADVDAMLERVSERTRIVFLANPNNPTGTYLPHDAIKRLHAGLPDNVLLVLDGAYAEYVRRNDYSSGLELAAEMPNVLMTRTFSKIHGLAALRLGWAFGPASVIDAIHRVRGPFNVSSLAQAAGIAALKDRSFVDSSLAHNDAELERVTTGLTSLGLTVIPSVCNFVLIDVGSADRASAADAYLRARNIYLRAMGAYKLPHCLRLSIGTAQANTDVLEALAAFQKT